jgi:hypothetical protein
MNTTISATDIKKLLTENICNVEFTKVNGETRIMPCTLRNDVVPLTTVIPGKESKKSNDSVMNVWCTDKNAWRSFKIQNLVSIEIKND